jgi:hypothetical protein
MMSQYWKGLLTASTTPGANTTTPGRPTVLAHAVGPGHKGDSCPIPAGSKPSAELLGMLNRQTKMGFVGSSNLSGVPFACNLGGPGGRFPRSSWPPPSGSTGTTPQADRPRSARRVRGQPLHGIHETPGHIHTLRSLPKPGRFSRISTDPAGLKRLRSGVVGGTATPHAPAACQASGSWPQFMSECLHRVSRTSPEGRWARCLRT